MFAFRILLAIPGFVVDLVRPHRCHWGCEFKTHRVELMAQHYYANHAGDRMATSEGHVNG